MSHSVLRKSAVPIDTTTLRSLTPQEWENRDILRKMTAFDEAVESKLGGPVQDDGFLSDEKPPSSKRRVSGVSLSSLSAVTPRYEAYEDDHETHERIADAQHVRPPQYSKA